MTALVVNTIFALNRAANSAPAWQLCLALLLSLSVAMLSGCSTTPVGSPTLPPLPSEIKRQPLPFPEPPSAKQN